MRGSIMYYGYMEIETGATYGYSNQSRFAKAVLRGGLERIRPTQFRVNNNQSNSPVNL